MFRAFWGKCWKGVSLEMIFRLFCKAKCHNSLPWWRFGHSLRCESREAQISSDLFRSIHCERLPRQALEISVSRDPLTLLVQAERPWFTAKMPFWAEILPRVDIMWVFSTSQEVLGFGCFRDARWRALLQESVSCSLQATRWYCHAQIKPGSKGLVAVFICSQTILDPSCSNDRDVQNR